MKPAAPVCEKSLSSRYLSARCYPPLPKGYRPSPRPEKANEALIFHQDPLTTRVPMPRGQGKPPRGVYLPSPPSRVAVSQRVSKHANPKHPHSGFGSRNGRKAQVRATLLHLGDLQTQAIAQARRQRRVTTGGNAA